MLTREWFSASELAALSLPGMPATKANVLAMADRAAWQRADWKDVRWRLRKARGGGVEFHVSVLPQVAQIKLTVDLTAVAERSEREAAKRELTRDQMWAWFDALPEAKRAEATKRLEALAAVRDLIQSGLKKVFVMQMVASRNGIKLSTLYAWEKCIHGVDRPDWLPYLAPRHVGRIATVACEPEAWEMLKGDWLRLGEPTFEACFRRLQEVAEKEGWAIPSARTLERRLLALPEGMRVMARKGREALKRIYPAQQRDRGMFHALEAVNADGHKWDVFVRWPDGYVGRPMMCAFQDLYSGMILSWRVDRTANKEVVRLAFGDLVEAYGIPDHCWLDNGRDFASKWLTGGTPNRYRFKVRDDEPAGIMTSLGITIHWTTPYAGQSKPIERAFRDFAGDTAKHPRFAGAYTGNNPTAKPEDYGSAAVPLEVFLATIGKEIAAHNARVGRRTPVCQGRSFAATFAESYERAPIKKATAEQRRLWLLAAEGIGAAKVDGSIHLLGNRYWSEFLHEHRGQKLTVRFDPQAMHQPVYLYRLDNSFLGAAECIEAVGFADADAARAHAQARGAFIKATKAALAAERKMTPQQVAALLPEPAEPTPAPETKVVRMTRGSAALAPIPIEQGEEDPREAAYFDALAQMNRARPGPAHLRVVNPDDDD